MFYRLRNFINHKSYNLLTRKILAHSSRSTTDILPVTLISQLCNKDFNMFLVAYHSFVKFCGQPSQVILIDDGSLTNQKIATLEKNIPNLSVKKLYEISEKPFPNKLCWERLLLAASIINNQYVIQLDSDTISKRKLNEVKECILNNVSFSLGTNTALGINFFPSDKVISTMKRSTNKHVQVLAEQNLPKDSKYFRGCAGFAGYARNSFSKTDLVKFYVNMSRKLGKVWDTWGCDQVASNFIIANSMNRIILPTEKYITHKPNLNFQEAQFIHFIGTNRFENFTYQKESLKFINTL